MDLGAAIEHSMIVTQHGCIFPLVSSHPRCAPRSPQGRGRMRERGITYSAQLNKSPLNLSHIRRLF